MAEDFVNATFTGTQASAGVITPAIPGTILTPPIPGTFTGSNVLNTLGVTDTTINGTVNAVGSPVTVTLQTAGLPIQTTGTYVGNLTGATPPVYIFDVIINGTPTGVAVSSAPLPALNVAAPIGTGAVPVDPNIPCFVTGTGIRVVRDDAEVDVPVEALQVGDLAVTASGTRRPIRWIGSKTVHTRLGSDTLKVMPVRIQAHAFGENRPARDLYVSPDHSIAVSVVDEVLIPAGKLVNGATIAYAETDTVTYWHVELDGHDLLVAENLPAESYLEMGENRSLLGRDVSDEVSAEAAARTHADFCRPFVSEGPLLAVVRARLQARAERQGWSASHAVTVRATAGGSSLPVAVIGSEVLAALPGGAGGFCLSSDTFSPARLGEADDREIGLSVYAITVTDAAGREQALDLDAPGLREGFHRGERRSGLHYRCSKGEIRVPAALLSGLQGPLMVRLRFEPGAVRGYTAPAALAETAPVFTQRPALALVA